MQKLGLHFGRLRALRLVIAIAVAVIICSSEGLGSERFHFKTWNTENGLPQNTVHSIAQTQDGYLWVATFDGLARFDGLRFKIFRKSNTPELPTNRLAGLFFDPEGRLWITTEDPKVIVLYENGKPDEHPRLLEHMHEISEASAAAFKETREIDHNLHRAQLEHLGLAAALMTLVESIASGTNTRFISKIDETFTTLSRDEAINLYRIAQESISNIIKHSGAEQAKIQLTETDETIVLSIEDDGKGMNAKEGGVGLGLKGIRERATMIGAELTIRSTTGKGARLIVSLPLRYEKYRPDLVLMDINMRPIDALTASREILCRDANARIIIVTQQQDARTRETALSIGVEAFIRKDDLMSLPELIRKKTTKSLR